MTEYKTTKQVYEENLSSKPIALKWARANRVRKIGRDYAWTAKNIEGFQSRNRKRGRKV